MRYIAQFMNQHTLEQTTKKFIIKIFFSFKRRPEREPVANPRAIGRDKSKSSQNSSRSSHATPTSVDQQVFSLSDRHHGALDWRPASLRQMDQKRSKRMI